MRNTLKQNQVQEYLGKTVSMVIKQIYLQSKEINKKPAKPFQALRHFFNQPSHIEIFPFLLSQIIPNARKGTSSLQTLLLGLFPRPTDLLILEFCHSSQAKESKMLARQLLSAKLSL